MEGERVLGIPTHCNHNDDDDGDDDDGDGGDGEEEEGIMRVYGVDGAFIIIGCRWSSSDG